MPIYEYKCSKCGRISEFLENSGSPVAKKCAHCGSEKLEKRFSTFSARVADGPSKKCHGCSDFKCPHAQGMG
jgi:putative FmdB family regulatory protein